MQFRGVSRRGSLVFGGIAFTTTPRLYEMTPDEAAVIQGLYGDRISLEPLEREAVEPQAETMPLDEEGAEVEPEDIQPKPTVRKPRATATASSGDGVADGDER